MKDSFISNLSYPSRQDTSQHLTNKNLFKLREQLWKKYFFPLEKLFKEVWKFTYADPLSPQVSQKNLTLISPLTVIC